MSEEKRPTLYERLGGIYNIATVVDDFIDRIMEDPRLNANPLVDEAHHRVGRPGFKYLVTEMVGWATGGPQRYTGRSMGDSHRHLNITPGEWEAFLDDFRLTLERFSVPAAEQKELFDIVGSTKGDIVIVKPEGAAVKAQPATKAPAKKTAVKKAPATKKAALKGKAVRR